MSRTRSTTILLLALASLSAFPAFSQLDTATISGRITDTSGAVIANAQVLATNIETNFESQSVTNGEGAFRIPSLRPGPYRVRVSAPGFKNYLRTGLNL